MHTMLVLNTAPELEEELVDCLLELPEVNGFTTLQVYGHGRHGQLSVAEQVRGRRKRLQVELIVERQALAHILAEVAQRVGGDCLYWELALTNPGRVGQPVKAHD